MKLHLATLLMTLFVGICHCIFCNDGSNPCKLDQPGVPNSYFLPENGYYCLDANGGHVTCTCPDNSTRPDQPCRICDRIPNPCGTASSVVTCIDANKSFACLCNYNQGELVYSSKPCDDSNIKPPPGAKCENGGVRDPTTNLCNCPSGYIGDNCEVRVDKKLCERIVCQSNGVCAVQPTVPGATRFQPKCLCRTGFDGKYCESQSVTGLCSSHRCYHGGVCRQRQIGSATYAYCQCKPGWKGLRCDSQYFRCRSSGYAIDEFMKNQGKYFSCTPSANDYLLEQLSCPNGLKFNLQKQLCLL